MTEARIEMGLNKLLNIDSRRIPGWTILDVRGELDINTAGELKEAVAETVGDGQTHVALDLAEVRFMDSTGLAAMVAGVKRAKEQGGELVLVCPNTQIRRILSITGLWKIMPIIESSEQLAKIA